MPRSRSSSRFSFDLNLNNPEEIVQELKAILRSWDYVRLRAFLELLSSKNIDLNLPEYQPLAHDERMGYETWLIYALKPNRHLPSITTLLKYGNFDLAARGSNGRTFLYEYILSGNLSDDFISTYLSKINVPVPEVDFCFLAHTRRYEARARSAHALLMAHNAKYFSPGNLNTSSSESAAAAASSQPSSALATTAAAANAGSNYSFNYEPDPAFDIVAASSQERMRESAPSSPNSLFADDIFSIFGSFDYLDEKKSLDKPSVESKVKEVIDLTQEDDDESESYVECVGASSSSVAQNKKFALSSSSNANLENTQPKLSEFEDELLNSLILEYPPIPVTNKSLSSSNQYAGFGLNSPQYTQPASMYPPAYNHLAPIYPTAPVYQQHSSSSSSYLPPVYHQSSTTIWTERTFKQHGHSYPQPAQAYLEAQRVYPEPPRVYPEPPRVYPEPPRTYAQPVPVYLEPASSFVPFAAPEPKQPKKKRVRRSQVNNSSFDASELSKPAAASAAFSATITTTTSATTASAEALFSDADLLLNLHAKAESNFNLKSSSSYAAGSSQEVKALKEPVFTTILPYASIAAEPSRVGPSMLWQFDPEDRDFEYKLNPGITSAGRQSRIMTLLVEHCLIDMKKSNLEDLVFKMRDCLIEIKNPTSRDVIQLFMYAYTIIEEKHYNRDAYDATAANNIALVVQDLSAFIDEFKIRTIMSNAGNESMRVNIRTLICDLQTKSKPELAPLNRKYIAKQNNKSTVAKAKLEKSDQARLAQAQQQPSSAAAASDFPAVSRSGRVIKPIDVLVPTMGAASKSYTTKKPSVVSQDMPDDISDIYVKLLPYTKERIEAFALKSSELPSLQEVELNRMIKPGERYKFTN